MYSPAAVSYRVLAPFVVIQPFSHRPPFVTVPRGAVIETREEIRSPGLAEIRLNNQPLLAFMRDIEEHTEPLASPHVVGVVDVDAFDELRAKVDAARDTYVEALDEQSEVLQQSIGMPLPDGTQRVQRVNQNVRFALKRYMQAQRELAVYVMKCT